MLAVFFRATGARSLLVVFQIMTKALLCVVFSKVTEAVLCVRILNVFSGDRDIALCFLRSLE